MDRTGKRGVTLIELIVVMAIIAIGAVLVAPNIGAWIPNYRLRSATRDVVSTLRTAQMKAISNNTPYRVSFPGAGTYILQYQNTDGITWTSEGVPQTLPGGVQISDITFPGNNATFNTNSTSSTGSITLQNTKGSSKQITLTTATGRVNVH
jgi:prepilin-type N-terminal cleavage/methylation domain-containing protein